MSLNVPGDEETLPEEQDECSQRWGTTGFQIYWRTKKKKKKKGKGLQHHESSDPSESSTKASVQSRAGQTLLTWNDPPPDHAHFLPPQPLPALLR